MRCAAVALVLCLVACGGGGGSSSGQTSTVQASAPKTFSLPSSYTKVTYPITVYLPAGYETSTDAKPVIYSMDDELQGSLVVQDAQQGDKLDAIVVSIGNLGSDRRFIDFDLPGASDYFKFLTLELIPQVEAQYRADKTRRTLMGYSLSGLAAMIALFEDNPSSRYFAGYVMTDPSLQEHTTELYAMEQALWDTTHTLPLRVLECSSTNGYPYADLPQKIIARGYQGLQYRFRLYTQLSHGAILAPCVDEGIRWVFGLDS